MISNLIVFLTWHDVTVKNAKEIFLENKDAPVNNWGFKIEGTTPESMKELVRAMKEAGKRVYLEVLAVDEAHCIDAATKAKDCGVDHILGTVYYDSVAEICSQAGMDYSPFVGLDMETTRLTGTVEDIVGEALEIEKKDVFGINLSGYRYIDGDPQELIQTLNAKLAKPLSIAGSVDSFEKVAFLEKNQVWAFTMGGALFEKKFGQTFTEQIQAIKLFLDTTV